ncbi:hypothetical protein [Parerythrobacter lacustris]|uniref:Uncharacterized protein n=1 Tax=Parerythrobacter lacustris TaxID=2969984 RepID=A0ABT1XRB2_9SPHN|nr:hypothetical protein [Parerythrobacter lacustris]MCR2833476.1 hypothetical protein [Parerythrobacter lacustris]
MDRTTQTITIGEHTFVAKSYATAREAQMVRQALFKGNRVEMSGEVPKISEFNTESQFEMTQELIRQMVVSMDGSTENLVDRCLDLPSSEFDELIDGLDAIVSKKKS